MSIYQKTGPVAVALLALFSIPTLHACRTTEPARVQMSDSAITTKVKSKLLANSAMSGLNISVDTEEGNVILHGRVKTEEEKRKAEEIARDTSGVVKVTNMLKVGKMDDKDMKDAGYNKDSSGDYEKKD